MNEAEKVVTNTIICTICGGAGHVPSDCKFRKNPDGTNAELNPDGSLKIVGVNRAEQEKLDSEVMRKLNHRRKIELYFSTFFSVSIVDQ